MTNARRGIVSTEMTDVLADHRQACDGFAVVVHAASGHWEAPSPCTQWNARGVLEHVIGFHDVLLLRPFQAKPTRPKDDPQARWALTTEALFSLLGRPGVLDDKRRSLLGALTTDVLLHTWDLAKAVGADATLDSRLCQICLDRALANKRQFEQSELFGPPVVVPYRASVQDRLLGFSGRDPHWSPTGD